MKTRNLIARMEHHQIGLHLLAIPIGGAVRFLPVLIHNKHRRQPA